MTIELKPLHEQVIVITGASSGIGLVTARMAASRGAKVVVAARSGDALAELEREISAAGGEALAVATDVANEEEVRRLASAALQRFGGFDTWVNNAGVSIYGKITEVPIEDHRRLFETNFWGVVYGSLAAVGHLRVAGGALINVGSTLSDRAIPLQGMYSSSKHAVKGFTDALRMELEEEGAPISVTLVKPGAIDTPYVKHAKNYLPDPPSVPPPVYAPDVVAETILTCAERQVRDVFVGGGGKALSFAGHFAPRLTDMAMAATMRSMQQGGPPTGGEDGLYSASGTLEERGGYPGHVSESSLYTAASLRPVLTGALAVAGIGLAAVGLARSIGKG
jgi:NAD(P)-dependent dehydrogenase (short-subunit alcohol dehydrogenase family)